MFINNKAVLFVTCMSAAILFSGCTAQYTQQLLSETFDVSSSNYKNSLNPFIHKNTLSRSSSVKLPIGVPILLATNDTMQMAPPLYVSKPFPRMRLQWHNTLYNSLSLSSPHVVNAPNATTLSKALLMAKYKGTPLLIYSEVKYLKDKRNTWLEMGEGSGIDEAPSMGADALTVQLSIYDAVNDTLIDVAVVENVSRGFNLKPVAPEMFFETSAKVYANSLY